MKDIDMIRNLAAKDVENMRKIASGNLFKSRFTYWLVWIIGFLNFAVILLTCVGAVPPGPFILLNILALVLNLHSLHLGRKTIQYEKEIIETCDHILGRSNK